MDAVVGQRRDEATISICQCDVIVDESKMFLLCHLRQLQVQSDNPRCRVEAGPPVERLGRRNAGKDNLDSVGLGQPRTFGGRVNVSF